MESSKLKGRSSRVFVGRLLFRRKPLTSWCFPDCSKSWFDVMKTWSRFPINITVIIINLLYSILLKFSNIFCKIFFNFTKLTFRYRKEIDERQFLCFEFRPFVAWLISKWNDFRNLWTIARNIANDTRNILKSFCFPLWWPGNFWRKQKNMEMKKHARENYQTEPIPHFVYSTYNSVTTLLRALLEHQENILFLKQF